MLRLESPFPEYALPRVWTWIKTYRHRVTDDTAPRTLAAFVAEWQAGNRRRKSWGVWSGEALCGFVAADISEVGVATCNAFFRPDHPGQGIVREALARIVQELFSSGVRKVMHMTDQRNHGMVTLFRSLGAKREGLLRAQTLRQGKPVDVMILSLLREKAELCRSSPPKPTGPTGPRSDSAPSAEASPTPEAPAPPLPPSPLSSSSSKAT